MNVCPFCHPTNSVEVKQRSQMCKKGIRPDLILSSSTTGLLSEKALLHLCWFCIMTVTTTTHKQIAVPIVQAFWATVCKTVCHTPSDRCLTVCPVLSVTLVYCGQTVGSIKMKLGTQVGLGPGHTMLDGDPAPLPKRGRSLPPSFRPISVVAKWLDG